MPQRDALQAAGCERLYDDTCSGSVTERPGLAKALDHMRAGDTIGSYARPTAINISTLIIRWPLDKNGNSRDFTSSRTTRRSISDRAT